MQDLQFRQLLAQLPLYLGFQQRYNNDKLQSIQPREAYMSFFDRLVDTPDYQAQLLGGQPTAPQGIAAPMASPMMAPPTAPMNAPMGMAKGGLTGVNEKIKDAQIMKVFQHYFENLGVDVKEGMRNLQKEIDQGLQLIPFESSVMGYKPLGSGTAQIHFFTVGTLKDLLNDMEYFFNYLKDKGVRTVYDTLPAPITTQMLVELGAKLQQSDNPKYKLKASI
jgi:hypothetical protein